MGILGLVSGTRHRAERRGWGEKGGRQAQMGELHGSCRGGHGDPGKTPSASTAEFVSCGKLRPDSRRGAISSRCL